MDTTGCRRPTSNHRFTDVQQTQLTQTWNQTRVFGIWCPLNPLNTTTQPTSQLKFHHNTLRCTASTTGSAPCKCPQSSKSGPTSPGRRTDPNEASSSAEAEGSAEQEEQES
jgi:hypothetical protein